MRDTGVIVAPAPWARPTSRVSRTFHARARDRAHARAHERAWKRKHNEVPAMRRKKRRRAHKRSDAAPRAQKKRRRAQRHPRHAHTAAPPFPSFVPRSKTLVGASTLFTVKLSSKRIPLPASAIGGREQSAANETQNETSGKGPWPHGNRKDEDPPATVDHMAAPPSPPRSWPGAHAAAPPPPRRSSTALRDVVPLVRPPDAACACACLLRSRAHASTQVVPEPRATNGMSTCTRLSTTAVGQGHARSGMTGSGWWRWARPSRRTRPAPPRHRRPPRHH